MTKKIQELNVESKHYNARLDVFLQSKLNMLSRTRLKKLIKLNFIKINNIEENNPAKKVKINDKILITFPPPENSNILRSKMPLDIIYDDEDIIIVNKAAGVVMHPGAGNHTNTLVNGLLFVYKNKLSAIGGKLRPGIVHRIDKDTSGIIVVAKNDNAHNKLSKQFKDHTIKRKYEALVWGSLRPQNGKIFGNISRSKKNRQLMEVSLTKGKKAITNYTTIEIYQNKNVPTISLIECTLETGRTHQIRVHMASKGNSIVGDKSYGKKIKGFKNINLKIKKNLEKFTRQALHAKSLGFVHPRTNREVFFEVKRPNDFDKLLKNLKKYGL